jgi:hypothetical protein
MLDLYQSEQKIEVSLYTACVLFNCSFMSTGNSMGE